MRKTLLTALLLCSFSAAYAGDIRTLKWEELVPADALPLPPPAPLHNLGQLSDVLSEEYGPGVEQQYPNAPVVPELNGLNIIVVNIALENALVKKLCFQIMKMLQ